MQTTSHVLMIRPAAFGFNAETAVNNHFQHNISGDLQQQALKEFDALVDLLAMNHISVTIINDTAEPATPDSIFPNNWMSFHEGRRLILYPMFASNRQMERLKLFDDVLEKLPGNVDVEDLSGLAGQCIYLEGTGSMVLDRQNKMAYACISERTNEGLFRSWCNGHAYQPILFHAQTSGGKEIYHTNVIMSVGTDVAVVCMEVITKPDERTLLKETLDRSGKRLINISEEQMMSFAGNMLELHNAKTENIWVMSSRAYGALQPDQLSILEEGSRIIHTNLDSIETAGGGSARCMIAEIFI